MKLFTFLFYGIPVEVKLGAVVFILWLYFFKVRPYIRQGKKLKLFSLWALVGVALLLFTYILHEATHAYLASMYGVSVASAGIDIRQIYVLIDMDLSKVTPYQYVLIYGLAPLVNLAVGLFLIFWVWIWGESLPENTLQYVARTNIYLFLFHILPFPFTDGGKVFAGTVWHLSGDPNLAEQLTWFIGLPIALLLFLMIVRGLKRRTDQFLSDL